MIGDDGGGVALVVAHDTEAVFSVGMGVMDEDFMAFVAESISDFLITQRGHINY